MLADAINSEYGMSFREGVKRYIFLRSMFLLSLPIKQNVTNLTSVIFDKLSKVSLSLYRKLR